MRGTRRFDEGDTPFFGQARQKRKKSTKRGQSAIMDESQAVNWIAKNIGIARGTAARLLRVGMGEGIPAPGKLSVNPRLYRNDVLLAWLSANAKQLAGKPAMQV